LYRQWWPLPLCDDGGKINHGQRSHGFDDTRSVRDGGRAFFATGNPAPIIADWECRPGDLRDFTAFAARAEPDVLMAVLREYYAAVGAVIARHEATLTRFSGDGVMVLVNAPVARENPALRGLRLAIDLQTAVQSLVVGWRAKGHVIGFGVGIAMGPAIVGTVGYEGRLDYTAIGNVVNLASRLCSAAKDTQILVDPVVAEGVGDSIALQSFGVRRIRGFEHPLQIFVLDAGDAKAHSADYEAGNDRQNLYS
jgi:adenylate cyclase